MNMPAAHRITRVVVGMMVMVMIMVMLMVVAMLMIMTVFIQKSKLLVLVGTFPAGTTLTHLDLLTGPSSLYLRRIPNPEYRNRINGCQLKKNDE